MEDHITDLDDEPPEHEDEEVRDATTQEDFPDDLIRALMDIALSQGQLKKAIKVQAE
jgi:hypothetical protein